MSVRVRPVRAADLAVCARIVAEEGLWQRYGVTEQSARATLREALKRADPFYVAVVDGRVAGFIWFSLTGTMAYSGYIRWIAAAPWARGRGVGKALMAEAEERTFRRGGDVFLLLSHFNRGAQRFYERLGYRRVGPIPDYLVEGITEYLYRKTRGPIASRAKLKRR